MIRVVLSRPRKFYLASWLIRKATRFPASHASIHWAGSGTFGGQVMVLESTAHGTGICHPGVWDIHNKIVRAYMLRPEYWATGRDALGALWPSLGTPYDYMGILQFAWRLLARWFFGLRLAAGDTPKTLFCSELVARWLIELSKRLGKGPTAIHPDNTSPADLVAILESMGCFECELS